MDSIDIAVNAIDNATRVLQATAESLEHVGKSGDTSTAGLSKINNELVKLITAERAAQAFALLSQEEKDAILAASALGDSTEENTQRFKVFGLTLSDLWSAFNMVQQGAQMLGQVFDAAVGPAIKLQTTFGKIEALTDTPASAIDGLRDSVIQLSKQVPVSSQELSEAFYYISSSGYQGAEAMDVLTASAKASAAGLGETQVIADAVTSTLNAYKMAGSDAARVTDVLVEAVRQGKGEPADFAGALGKVLPIAAAAGVNIEQVAASMAVMTRAGLNADEAATALRGTIGALEAPGKQAQDALTNIGLSADQVRQSIREKGLLETLQMLMEKTGGNVEILDLIIPNIRALTGVLSSAGSQVEAYAEILGKMERAAGATDKAFGVMSDTVESKGKRLENSIGAIRDKIANGLLPVLSDAASAADTLLNGADRIREAYESTRTKIEQSKTTYEDYRVSLLATAVAAGELTQAQMDQYLSQGYVIQGGMGQVDITDRLIGKIGLMTQAQWDASHGAYGVAGALDESSRAAQRSAQAALDAKTANEQKAEADKVAAQAAFENAQAAEAQAKAQEKARKEAADSAIAYGQLGQSLKDATTADLANLAIANLGQSLKSGAISTYEYNAALRAIQVQYDLVTPKSLAEADAMTTLNKLHDAGQISGTLYAEAIGKVDKAAGDGKVTLDELGIKISDAGTKADTARGRTKGLEDGLDNLGGSAQAAAGKVKNVYDNLSQLPARKDVDIYINVHGDVPDVVGGSGRSNGGNRGDERAAGGSVISGWPYWVGEEGPELFVPSMNGRILSRSDAVQAVGRQSDQGAIGQIMEALRTLMETRLPTIQISIGQVASDIDVTTLAYRVVQEIQARQ